MEQGTIVSFQGGPYQSSSEADSPTPGDSESMSTVFGSVSLSQSNLYLFPALTPAVSSASSSIDRSPQSSPHSPSVSSFTDDISDDDNDRTITTSLPHRCVVSDMSCSTVTEISGLPGDQTTSTGYKIYSCVQLAHLISISISCKIQETSLLQ